jgi:hypothetical protein
MPRGGIFRLKIVLPELLLTTDQALTRRMQRRSPRARGGRQRRVRS